MKPSELPAPLLIVLTAGICLTAFLIGNQTGQWIFPGWSELVVAQAAQPVAQATVSIPVVDKGVLPDQENTLFILLGDSNSGTLLTVWHIKALPGSPVFMHLLVPSARFGASFDQAVYDLLASSNPGAIDEQALAALFSVHGFSWEQVIVLDLPTFTDLLTELNRVGEGRFMVDPEQVLRTLPHQINDSRLPAEVINDQVDVWSGLCPLFLSSPAVQAGGNYLLRPHPAYPVCVASDDLR